MTSATARVVAALEASGVRAQILEFDASTKTAHDAATAVGTTVGQIVKSLVFLADGKPVLVLASGANRVDLIKLAHACSAHAVRRADADTVRTVTGFAIGGVPPLGHDRPLPVFIDRALLQYEVVYAAAGTPNAVLAISPHLLQQITSATAAELHEAR